MTQNMDKYFGFRVSMDDSLEPADIELLKSVASELARIHQIDTTKYLVYFHHLVLHPQRYLQFTFEGGIDKRLMWLVLQFEVNKKQSERGTIRFFNSVLSDDNLPEHHNLGILPSYADYEVSFQIPGKYFTNRNYFKSAIITFISSSVKRDHQKIKATVTAIPSTEFAPFIRAEKNRVAHTKLDVEFQRYIQLVLPFESREKSNEITNKEASIVNQFNNYGQAGAFGTHAKASDFSQSQGAETAELLKLLTAINQDGAEHVGDQELVRQALSSVNREDALGWLSKSSLWVLDKAEKLALPLASAMIKQALGLSGLG
jgi:hypothetical protein